MSDALADHSDMRMDAYLDGLMERAERESFEREIERDSSLHAQVEAQSLIDASVKRVFAPPASVLPPLGAASGVPSQEHWTGRRLPASVAMPLAAAAVLILTVGTWQWWHYEPPIPESRSYASMGEVYRTAMTRGFNAHYVCETDRQFATAFNYWLDQPLLPNRPDHVDWVGISRSRIRSELVSYILLRFNGREVMVFVERHDPAAVESPSAGAGLHIHARRLNQLMLYEVTPSETPEVLDLFYEPDIPEEWKDDVPYW